MFCCTGALGAMLKGFFFLLDLLSESWMTQCLILNCRSQSEFHHRVPMPTGKDHLCLKSDGHRYNYYSQEGKNKSFVLVSSGKPKVPKMQNVLWTFSCMLLQNLFILDAKLPFNAQNRKRLFCKNEISLCSNYEILMMVTFS